MCVMAWKPWYERAAEMNTSERDEFLRGVFNLNTGRTQHPFAKGLITGYLISKALMKDTRRGR